MAVLIAERIRGSGRRFGSAPGLVALATCVSGVFLVNEYLVAAHPIRAFVLNLVLVTLALVVIGVAVQGRFDGILIDDRNRVSLSKFQATLWTVLVVASLVTVAAHNLGSGYPEPLNFSIPVELLSAMGISAASFATAPLVLSLKAQTSPTAGDVHDAERKAGDEADSLRFAGKVFGRRDSAQASWIDMVRGEEVGNAYAPDLGKVQQLLISLLVVGIYGFAVKNSLVTSSPSTGLVQIPKLPTLDEQFVWLMAVSHASYLAYKAAPHTKDGPADGPGRGGADPRLTPVG